MTKTIEEKAAAIDAKMLEVRAAINADEKDKAKEGVEILKSMVSDYNEDWKKDQFNEFLAADLPVLAAIKRLNIMRMTVSVKTNDDGDVISCAVKDVKRPSIKDNIDLAEFEDYASVRVTANGQWRYWVENFTVMMAARVCESIGKKAAAERYRSRVKLSAEAREAGRAADGNANAVETLQKIVDAIVFIDSGKKSKSGAALNTIKVTTNDLAYINSVMCKETAGIEVALPNDKTMRRLICKAIHKNVTDKDYEFLYDESDDADASALPHIPGFTAAQVRAIVAD